MTLDKDALHKFEDDQAQLAEQRSRYKALKGQIAALIGILVAPAIYLAYISFEAGVTPALAIGLYLLIGVFGITAVIANQIFHFYIYLTEDRNPE